MRKRGEKKRETEEDTEGGDRGGEREGVRDCERGGDRKNNCHLEDKIENNIYSIEDGVRFQMFN